MHVILHRRHDTSCLLLRNGLPLEPYTLLLQLKSLFLLITGQNKCTCKIIKKCTLLLSSTVTDLVYVPVKINITVSIRVMLYYLAASYLAAS